MTRNDKYCLALAAMLLASCNNEEVFGPTPGGNTSGSHEVRLTIPGVGSGAVPYSIATESENKLEDFDVYVFGMDTVFGTGNYLLEEVFRSRAGLKLDDHGTSKTATIQLKGTNAKRLYYVANSWREGVNTLSLDSVELNKTTTTEFRRKLTDPIPVHLACPLMMTDSSDLITDPVKTDALDVELKRSMARFDIINNTYDTEFRIDWVEVEKARQYAYIFPQSPAYDAPMIEKMARIDFKALHNANKGETNSVFYMYPTMVDGEASVSLGGERTGSNVKVIYPVKFVKADKTTPLPIEANKRYVIEVLSSSVAYIDATIRVVDWFVGDTTRSEAGDGTIKLSLHKGAAGAFNDNTLVIAAAAGTETLMDVECDSEWEFADADLPSWIKVDTTGFSLNKVAKSFRLTAKNANPSGKTQRVGTIMLRNKRHKAITQPLVVKQIANAFSSIDLTCSRLAGGAIRMTGAMDSFEAEVALKGTATSYTYDIDAIGETWLTIETTTTPLKTTNPGEKYLKFSAAANTTNNTLSATVTLTTDNGLEQIIKVTQAPKVLNLIASSTNLINGKLSIDNKATDTDVTIKAQTGEAWTVTKENVTGENADWLTFDKPGDTGDGTFTIKAAANATADDRVVLVTVAYTNRPDIRQQIVVTQKGGTVIVHNVTANYTAVTIDKAGAITDNTAITVTTSPDTDSWKAAITGNNDGTEWVTIDKTTGANNGQIALTAGKENTTGSERKATITITNDEDDTKTTTVTITQAGN